MKRDVVDLTLLIAQDCPNAPGAEALAQAVVEVFGEKARLHKDVVDDQAGADAKGMHGSPTFLVDGRDVDAVRAPSAATTACRSYQDGAGLPPQWLLEARLVRALGPRGLLFLCVANSARSQMGEGIARQLAPTDVKVQSAGSRPTQVRPEAIAALAEIGIDISRQRSKSVSEIPPAEVDVVVTLCGEQECPLFLGDAIRLHWGLPDPASEEGDDSARLDAFRQARDELGRRIEQMIPGPGSQS